MKVISLLAQWAKSPRSLLLFSQGSRLIRHAITRSRKRPVTILIFAIVSYSAARVFLLSTISDAGFALWFAEREILLFSAIVVIGCVGEALEGDWWKARHGIFAIWVALGVTGEAFSDGEVYKASSALQTADDADIQNAKTDAAHANERAKALETQAASLKNDAAASHAEASLANERAGLLEAQAAASRRDAEHARLEQARLKASVLWRQLDDGQCTALLAAIPQNLAAINVTYPTGDAEATLFAIDFENCFAKNASLHVSSSADGWQSALPIDLIISGTNLPVRYAVTQALMSSGVSAVDRDDNELEARRISCFGSCGGAADIKVIVGSKPVFR